MENGGENMRLTRRETAIAAFSACAAALGGGLIVRLATRPPRDASNVRSFGAVGDGKHDDAPALQRAIDAGTDVLHFPAGVYRLGSPLRPRSGQTWTGDGATRTRLAFGGSPKHPPFNLLHDTAANLSQFEIHDIGFLGGRGRQLIPSADGQKGFAIYLRGAIRDLSLIRCRFEHFGDGRGGGGGVVLGAVPGQASQGIRAITVEDCVFTDNGNVPGLYIGSGDRPDGDCDGIRIRGNSFAGSVGSTKFQNAVYILGGGPQATIRHVDISHNRFDVSTPIDAAIEINWVDSFAIAGNTMHFQATVPGSTAILIRDGCVHGTVSANVVTSDTIRDDLHGILALNFTHPGRVSDIVISDNVLSGVSAAIAADRGSEGIVISGNRITGTGTSGSFGIRVVDASDVLISANTIDLAKRAVVLGRGDLPPSGLRNVVVEHNVFRRCGGGDQALISTTGPAVDPIADALIFRGNIALDNAGNGPLLAPALAVRS